MKLLTTAALALAFCPAAGGAFSDEPAYGVDDVPTARPIVVTATRSAQDAADIAANVTIIDRATIEESPASRVDHLLRQIPGFSLLRQQSSIISTLNIQGVSMRGIGQSATSRTLVLLDGIPLNDPFGNFIVWSRIPFESIEKVEVVRGGGSGIWGNLALGGVIQVLTERPEKQTVRLQAEGGNRDNSNLDLFAGDRQGKLSYSFGGNIFDTDGYYLYAKDELGPVDERAGVRNETYNGRVDFDLTPDSRIYARAGYSHEDKKRGTPLAWASMINRYYSIGADLGSSGGSNWQFNLFTTSRTGQSQSTRVSRSRDSESPNHFRFDEGAKSVGTSLQWAREFGREHRLSVGGDVLWSDTRANEHTGWDSDAEAFTLDGRLGGKQRTGGVFAQEIWTPSIHWNVVLGARLDQIRNRDGMLSSRDLQTGTLLDETISPTETKSAFSPSLGIVYHATNEVSLRGSAYQAFRAPTVSELYRTTGTATVNAGNPDLGPEELTGGELGANYEPLPFVSAKVTGFWSEVDGTITLKTIGVAEDSAQVIDPCGLVSEDGTCRQQNNVGRLRSRGIEFESRLGPLWFTSLSCSYIYDDAELIESPDPDLVGKRIRHVPRHHIVLSGTFDRPSLFTAHLQWRMVGTRYENDLNDLPLDRLSVYDLNVSRKISPWSEGFLSVENLFDAEYEVRPLSTGLTEIGMPRMIHGGLRVRM